MKKLLIIFVLTFSFVNSANALYFLKSKQHWDMVPNKEVYAAGLFEGLLLALPSTHSWNEKVSECITGMGANGSTLVEVVETYYEKMSNWKYPPVLAMYEGLSELCYY